MIKPNEYVVKLLINYRDKKGRYFRNSDNEWVPINEAESYKDDFVKSTFHLGSGVHELLKVEPDGSLTHIR